MYVFFPDPTKPEDIPTIGEKETTKRPRERALYEKEVVKKTVTKKKTFINKPSLRLR